MKKKIVVMLSLVLCLMLSISLAACNKNKHEAKSEWKFDNAQHWHECATKGHDDKLDVAAHTWNDGVVTTDPTETTDGVKTFTCTVCGATKTAPVEKLEHKHTYATEWSKDETNHWHAATCGHDVKKDEASHTWNDGVVTTNPTETTDGVKTLTCTVCGETKTESVPKLEHTHDYDIENYKFDATNHWFECDCGEKVEIKAHTYGVWSEKTPAGVDQNKQYSRKCSECQHEEVLTFDNTKTNGTYCVAITEIIKVSDKKFAKVQVLRGTITVGENFVIDGLSGTFTIDGMKDSKGKDITSASFGQSVSIEIGAENGDLEQVTNRNAGGRLAYQPDTANAHTTFTAQITVDLSDFSGALNSGRTIKLDLYNINTGMMDCSLVLPEGVNVAQNGKSYVVTITLPDSRALWAGMEFTCKVYDSASSSDITVATGIILTAAN